MIPAADTILKTSVIKMPPSDLDKRFPPQIRISIGSAIVLGLSDGKLDAAPKTAYLMTYREGKCTANCAFCPQARTSSSRADMLSRVSWPTFQTKLVVARLKNAVDDGRIKRVCIQSLNFPQVFTQLQSLLETLFGQVIVPVSVSCQPLERKNVEMLAKAGVERIGIPLDAATRDVFEKVKGKIQDGPYDWDKQFGLLKEAVGIFGKGKVSTHLIVGLGETEKEMVYAIQECVNLGVIPGLFAFTPVQGTTLENLHQPSIEQYRKIQLARHLIVRKTCAAERMSFSGEGRLAAFGVENETLVHIIQTREPFLTSGCPDCNRPYYNEKPGGPLYNYPRKPTKKELSEISRQLGLGS